MNFDFFSKALDACVEYRKQLDEKTNEVARLRDLLNSSIAINKKWVPRDYSDYRKVEDIEQEARLAPAPKEPVTECDCHLWKQPMSCPRCEEEPVIQDSQITEPALDKNTKLNTDKDTEIPVSNSEWRELGPDEEIHTGDQVQAKHHDRLHGVWLEVFPYEIGAMPIDHEAFRYRTSRPLPKQEEMPLEQYIDMIDTPCDWSDIEARHVTATCLRYLRDEIQKLKEDSEIHESAGQNIINRIVKLEQK